MMGAIPSFARQADPQVGMDFTTQSKQGGGSAFTFLGDFCVYYLSINPNAMRQSFLRRYTT